MEKSKLDRLIEDANRTYIKLTNGKLVFRPRVLNDSKRKHLVELLAKRK